MSVWHDRYNEANYRSLGLWLDLLRQAEAYPDDPDPARLLTIAQCQSKLSWYKRVIETLDRLCVTGDPLIDVHSATLRNEHETSDENRRWLREALIAAKLVVAERS